MISATINVDNVPYHLSLFDTSGRVSFHCINIFPDILVIMLIMGFQQTTRHICFDERLTCVHVIYGFHIFASRDVRVACV